VLVCYHNTVIQLIYSFFLTALHVLNDLFQMGSSQLYSLTWGEFGTSLVSAVQLLRSHNDLVDVTLAAGGRSFPAHKIVLSAASPFLLDLLKVCTEK
jgi:hypothetical protein